MTLTNRTILVLIMWSSAGTILNGPSRVWAAEREQLHFYTRIGSQQVNVEGISPTSTMEIGDPLLMMPLLDIGAGMHYTRGGIQLQVGPRFDLTSPSLLPQQKVIMEGQIGVRW